MVKLIKLFDLTRSLAGVYLERYEYPWEALGDLPSIIRAVGKTLPAEFKEVAPEVWVHSGAEVAPTAYIGAPAIICKGAEIKHCAYVRESALVGEDCVVGNSTELKNVILFDGVQVPHYNYVGDSILGYKAHLGAGAITSNYRADHGNVTVHADRDYPTGRNKVGAMLGDYAEIGCNSVLNPGTVVGRRSIVYPLSSVRGFVPEDSIYKGKGNIVARK